MKVKASMYTIKHNKKTILNKVSRDAYKEWLENNENNYRVLKVTDSETSYAIIHTVIVTKVNK